MTGSAGIDVRPLEPRDHAAWLRLWRGYQAFYGVDIPREVSGVTWARLLDPATAVGGALAWEGASAVGLVHHVRHCSTWTESDYCYLHDLFVAPGVRGKGIGRRLIEYVYEVAARDGCVRVYWLTHETNATARRLYDSVAERTGFIHYRREVTGELPQPRGERSGSARDPH